MKTISFEGIGTRFIFAFALVCLTWNPSRYNYVEWALAQWHEHLAPLVVFVGLVLLIAWIVFVRATARSLGVLGIIGKFVPLGIISENVFWFVAIGFILLALATFFKGL